ncbi:MAG: hypothetical protein JRI68_21270 [Deltaproteobacteria bacterium]|nr:hypothetical protein [Deltaproteobacteria bacterium]
MLAIPPSRSKSGQRGADGVGIDGVGETGHPNWEPGATDRRWDYEGDMRATGGPWDLGVDER